MGLNAYNRFIEALSAAPGLGSLYKFDEKEKAVFDHVRYMISRTQTIFQWSGLPDSIPQRNLELLLQVNGYCGIAKVNDALYAFYGGLGGEPDAYYMPTIFTVSNPALNYSANLRIDTDCVIIPNDALYSGLMPLCYRYATLLSENELSMQIATVNSRIVSLISAPDDRTQKAAEKYLDDIANGAQGVIAENAFLDGIRVQPYSTAASMNNVKTLIELEQYLTSTWWQEVGINSNFNMKRERLSSDETSINENALLPLIDDMLHTRELACEKINAMFGTNISVSRSDAWQNVEEEAETIKESDTDLEENGGVEDESELETNV